MSLTPGQRISAFDVVGELGAGGMGVVYRARDTRLDRDVAIKVLPEGWDADAEHAGRFVREAKTLAALSHPNIAHVYGFEELDGRRLLILELVEGEELAERLARGPLSWREAREICLRIAEGLEAAHERGIVHRDLKPGNVRITPDGTVKLLDFGLAKSLVRRTDTESETRASSEGTFHTESGVLVGTPTYMSPERVRGRPDDRRGDIWAFGCVLYECLVGTPPFDGESVPDTLGAIVEREPDLAKLPDATPEELHRLISRCLEKDPRTRLRDIGEARIALERMALAGDAPVDAGPRPQGRVSRRGALPYAGAAVLVGVGWWIATPGHDGQPADPLKAATVTRLTDDAWSQFDATISRDGKHVAFASDRAGIFDVFYRMLGTQEDRNVTKGTRNWWGVKVRDIEFDCDSTRLLQTSEDGAFSVSLQGEERKQVLDGDVVNTTWSRDGTRCVYQKSDRGDPLFLAYGAWTGGKELLRHSRGLHQHYPAWSPFDDWVYVVRGRPTTLAMDLWRVRPELGSEPEQLTFDLLDVSFPTPVAEDMVLFLAREANGAGPWLWVLDVASGLPPRRLFRGTQQYTSLAASQDGMTLVATEARTRSSLYRIAIRAPGDVATEADVERVPGLEDVSAQAPRFAGDDLYFISSRSSGYGLWGLRGEDVLPLLDEDDVALLAPPAVSPDRKRLALVLRRGDETRVWTAGADGGLLNEIVTDVQVYGAPTWSPDGKFIAVGGSDERGPALFVFSVGGGPPLRLVDDFAVNPEWSPRGDLIVYSGSSEMAFLPLMGVNPDTGETVELPDVGVTRTGERYRFLPDGTGLVVAVGIGILQNLLLIDLETMEEPRPLTQFTVQQAMRTFDIDPSGRHIVFDRTADSSDVILIRR